MAEQRITIATPAGVGRRFRTIRYQQRGLPPTTLGGPYTVETNVADAAAVIDAETGGRAWVIGHSWGGHLALVMEEFGKNLHARFDDATRRRLKEIETREDAGEATEEESLESLALIWPNYFADPPNAPPMPPLRVSTDAYAGTFASIAEHAGRGTLTTGLPNVPADIPVLFIYGARSPLPPRTTTETAALIPHAQVEGVEDAGHFPWLEFPDAMRASIDRLPV